MPTCRTFIPQLIVASLWALPSSGALAATFSVVHNFTQTIAPNNVAVIGHTLYGTAGGSSIYGFDIDSNTLSTVYTTSNPQGPIFPLAVAAEGSSIYGVADNSTAAGAVFRINPDGTGLQELHSFTAPNQGPSHDGLNPITVSAYNGRLYGTTLYGGDAQPAGGTLFGLNQAGSGFQVLHSFIDGLGPAGPALTIDNDVIFGALSDGHIFRVNTDGSGYSEFSVPNGVDTPLVVAGSMLYGLLHNGSLFSVHTDGTGYQQFDIPVGASKQPTPLVLEGAVLYGATAFGGPTGSGELFRVNTDGSGYSVLHSFSAIDGGHPDNLVLIDDYLFGTAGSNVFRYGPLLVVAEPSTSVLGALAAAALALFARFKSGTTRFRRRTALHSRSLR